MKTENLIALMAADTVAGRPPGRLLARAFVPAVGLSLAGLASGFGFRPDLGDPSVAVPVAAKLAAGLLLAAAAALVALRLARPGNARLGNGLLMLAPAIVAGWIGFDIAVHGLADLPGRVMGTSVLRCLSVIPLLSLAPLAALLLALRAGATTAPGFSGFVAGLAAGGTGAAVYALNCGDDSPFFVAAWYGLAVLLVGCVGALAGRRVLAW
jgi:hypothetical protein